MYRFLALVLIPFALSAAPQPPALRLNHDVEPIRINLDLNLDPAQDTFSGSMTINLDVKQEVAHFWLNAADIQVTEARIEVQSQKLNAQIIPGGEDFVGFQFPAPLSKGPARFTLRYTGKVNLKSSEGIFRSSRNQDQYLFTQFEPLDARRAFPCFDEPDFKIPWQITLHVPAQQVAVSNTSVESETPESNNRKTIRFRETKPLPSYLIAFAVGPLEFVEAGHAGSHQVPVRIVVPRGDKDRAKYAAGITAEILTRLEQYFGIPYPYDKADQLAVPLSFGGAMENPGLVTYDSSLILSPPGADTEERQRLYTSVAAHELSHQWFGDMVTMFWWNDVWLNESFATWSSANLLAHWKPEWETRTNDQTARLYAVAADMKTTARRINQPAETKSDIGNAFDGITYQKGGSVLAMFENAIGPDQFQKAVHNYLQAHLFGNARAEDFLNAIGQESNPQYAAAFSTFLNQNGVPRVSINLRCASDTSPVLQIEQQKLLPVGSAGDRNQAWTIPICAAYSYGAGRQQTCQLVKEKQSEITLSGKGCPTWLLANNKEVGYYEAVYPAEWLTKLVGHRDQLSLAEQTGLLRDVHILADSGEAPLNQALGLAAQTANDPHRQIASAAIELATVRPQLIPTDLRGKYSSFIASLFKTRAEQVGWKSKPDETQDITLLRPQLVPFVATATDDPVLVKEATELANAWLTDRSVVTPDVVEGLLTVAAQHGDEQLFNKFLAAAQAEKDSYFQERLIGALGHFRDRNLAARAVQLGMDGTFDQRLTYRLTRGMTQEPANAGLPYEYTKAHYDELIARMPSGIGTDYAAAFPGLATANGCSDAAAADLKTSYTERMQKVQGGPRSLAIALETIKLCAAQKPQAEQSLRSFLESFDGKAQQ